MPYTDSEYIVTAIILTDDGASRDQRQLIREAQLTKKRGIVLIVIGIGDALNEDTLISVASHNKLYIAKNYEALGMMSLKLSVILCQGQYMSVVPMSMPILHVCGTYVYVYWACLQLGS